MDSVHGVVTEDVLTLHGIQCVLQIGTVVSIQALLDLILQCLTTGLVELDHLTVIVTDILGVLEPLRSSHSEPLVDTLLNVGNVVHVGPFLMQWAAVME